MKYVLSLGAGVCSTGLLLYLHENKYPLDLVIHADTGEERDSTAMTLKQVADFCRINNYDFKIVTSDKGNLYDYYYKKRKVMSFMKRDCTGKFKVAPIRKYLRIAYGKKEKFVTYMGYTIEEFSRMKPSNVKYIENKYPMIDNKITRNDCKILLLKYKIKASKSACKGCIYTKKHEWIKMLIENPKEFDRHLNLEMNGTGYPKITINPNYKLIDLKEAWLNQKSLDKFRDVEASCDVIAGCFT